MAAAEANDGLRVIPLGGAGEIGMNCLVIEQRTSRRLGRLVIDCGLSFPFGDYGVESFHPRFDYLLEQPAALDGLVLTHAHEDHGGALTPLLEALAGHLVKTKRRLDVWAPPYAVELARARLVDSPGLAKLAALHPVEPGQRFQCGAFRVEPIRVTHSMVDSTALALDTAVGKVVHSGDIKLDPSPSDGELTDEARLAELGDAGVRLLLSDSTNILEEGRAGSESDAAEALSRVIGAAEHRVVVGLFASNLHRLQAVADAAREHGRRLCLLGRSLRVHVEIASRIGRLRWPSDLMVSPEMAARLARGRIVYAATGTQGEPRAALRRLASDQHGELRLEPGDTVVLSSRIIPGNERLVHTMVSDLLRLGVQLHSRTTNPRLHVSGHGHRHELIRLLQLVRPAAFIPVHGTTLHLQHHAAIAREVGVGQVLVLHDGEVAQLTAEGIGMLAPVPAGKVATAGGVELSEEVLRERRILGRSGLVHVVAVLATSDRGAEVEAAVRGVPNAQEVARVATRAARAALADAAGRGRSLDVLDVVERIRRSVRQRLGETLGYRPPVDVTVLGG